MEELGPATARGGANAYLLPTVPVEFFIGRRSQPLAVLLSRCPPGAALDRKPQFTRPTEECRDMTDPEPIRLTWHRFEKMSQACKDFSTTACVYVIADPTRTPL